MAKQQATTNTGLPTVGNQGEGRWYNKNGEPNIVKTGAQLRHRFSLFHILLSISNVQFISLVVLIYFCINLVFAAAYFALGPQSLGIDTATRCTSSDFWNCFFFSAQTLTTVGYGALAPQNLPANIISSIESLLGLLLFALITGLSYARFSRPKSGLLFSDNVLLSPYEGGVALMFRVASGRNTVLTDVQSNVIMALNGTGDAAGKPEFYVLKLETERIQTLALNWTIVHAIREDSPLFGLSVQELKDRKFELLVSLQAYDEYYSNLVKTRSSYTASEIVENAKFEVMYNRGGGNAAIELQIDKLHNYHRL
jgi:inward rectifier potassium channel